MMQTIAEDKSIRNQSNEGDGHPPEISIFLPVFNEEPNLRPLHEKLNQSLAQLQRTAEIICSGTAFQAVIARQRGKQDSSGQDLRQVAYDQRVAHGIFPTY